MKKIKQFKINVKIFNKDKFTQFNYFLLQNFWFFGLVTRAHAIQLFGLAQAHANQLLCNKPNLLKQAIQIHLEIGITSPNYNYKGKPFVIKLYLIIYLFLMII